VVIPHIFSPEIFTRRFIQSLVVLSAFALLQGCSDSTRHVDPTVESSAANEAAARQAKVTYLAGINSNNLTQFLSTLTDDVVYVAPNTPVMVGKAAVSAWVQGYLEAYQAQWEKTTDEFIVRGDLAYERYTYRSVDTPRAGGPAAGTPVMIDRGSGLNIYRRGGDGMSKPAGGTDVLVNSLY